MESVWDRGDYHSPNSLCDPWLPVQRRPSPSCHRVSGLNTHSHRDQSTTSTGLCKTQSGVNSHPSFY